MFSFIFRNGFLKNNAADLDVAVLILFFERVEQTIQCIESFLPSGVKIYILNNGSTIESRNTLGKFCKFHNKVKILDVDENLGVAAGRNYLISHTSEEWMLFIDSDITMQTSRWVRKFLKQVSANREVEVFIPKLYLIPDKKYANYESMVIKDNVICGKKIENDLSNIFPGGASFVHRKLFERLGGYDDQMFTGFEDNELSIRAHSQGEPVKAKLIHDIKMIHEHLPVKNEADKRAVRTRYQLDHLENSYNRIVRKYGFNMEGDYRAWVKKQTKKMCLDESQTGESRKKRVLIMIQNLGYMSGAVRSLCMLSIGLANQGYEIIAAYYVGTEGTCAEELKKNNIEVVNLGFNKNRLSLWERFKVIVRLRRIIKRNDIGVIHAHHYDADYFAVLASLFMKVNCIVTIHAPSYLQWAKKRFFRYTLLIFPVVQHFICVSNEIALKFLKDYTFLNNKVSVIHNTLPPESFTSCDEAKRKKIRDEFEVADDELLLGMVGNITMVKGINFFLEAINIVKDRPFKALVVGRCFEKKLDDQYRKFIQEKGLGNQVIFAGFREDIDAILDAIDIFILPSIVETDPWALTEAMSKSKPIIASNVGGIPEKLKDGETGVLVPAGNSEALAQAINRCFDNIAQMDEFGKKAKKYLEDHFPYDEMLSKNELLYQDLTI